MARVAAAWLLAAGAAFAQDGGERSVATCHYGEDGATILITERDGKGFWTEGDRRVEAQMIRSVASDIILGITANRLDGSISMLSLYRPSGSAPPRRRAAAVTVHHAVGDRIEVETHPGYCDVEDLR